ncbi:MAG: 4-amino-4-deoxy-L-arabinose transferase-like glycosyltransferase [Alphaproteobacteria bacterium]
MGQFTFLLLLPWILSIMLLGRISLKVIGCHNLTGITKLTFAYWLGYVAVGLIFTVLSIAGSLNITSVTTVLVIASATILIRNKKKNTLTHFDQGHFLSSLFILAALLTLPASMIAPTESSSLAYHFALPKTIAETGTLVADTNTFANAGPLVSHVISAASYIVGGETLMMLHNWSMSIMAGLAAFALARRRLRTAPSWLFATVVFTLPALTYTAGTGIIEPRLMGLITLSALSLFLYARSERLSWLILSAILIAGACNIHITGLFAAGAMLAALVMINKDFGYKKCLVHTALYSFVAMLVVAPFYLWAFQQTGSFFLPFLTDITAPETWSAAQQTFFNNHYVPEAEMMERTKLNMMFNYPLEVTMNARNLGIAHLGLGPVFLMALVPSMMLLMRRFPFMSWEKTIGVLELHVAIFCIYYALWFSYGFSMEPKYLLATFPLLALPAWVVGQNLIARSGFALRSTMLASIFVLVAIQMGISVGMNKPAIAVFFKKDSLSTYIAQKSPALPLAQYLKSTMEKGDRVVYTELGTMNYQLGSKGIYAPAVFQEKIPVAYGSPTDILNAALNQRMTMWVTKNNVMNPAFDTSFNAHKNLRKLISYGCFKEESYIEPKHGESYYIYRYVQKCAGHKDPIDQYLANIVY